MLNAHRLLTALALAAALGTPLKAEDIDAGAYLAARVAEAENDFQAATAWYGKAIMSDGGNARLLEGSSSWKRCSSSALRRAVSCGTSRHAAHDIRAREEPWRDGIAGIDTTRCRRGDINHWRD